MDRSWRMDGSSFKLLKEQHRSHRSVAGADWGWNQGHYSWPANDLLSRNVCRLQKPVGQWESEERDDPTPSSMSNSRLGGTCYLLADVLQETDVLSCNERSRIDHRFDSEMLKSKHIFLFNSLFVGKVFHCDDQFQLDFGGCLKGAGHWSSYNQSIIIMLL